MLAQISCLQWTPDKKARAMQAPNWLLWLLGLQQLAAKGTVSRPTMAALWTHVADQLRPVGHFRSAPTVEEVATLRVCADQEVFHASFSERLQVREWN